MMIFWHFENVASLPSALLYHTSITQSSPPRPSPLTLSVDHLVQYCKNPAPGVKQQHLLSHERHAFQAVRSSDAKGKRLHRSLLAYLSTLEYLSMVLQSAAAPTTRASQATAPHPATQREGYGLSAVIQTLSSCCATKGCAA